VVKRSIPGSALKAVLKRSKDFDSQDAQSLSISNETKRGLVTIGVIQDGERDELLVNGESVDDKRLYTVATTDYAGFGDTGYVELTSVAFAGPILPRDYRYLCPLTLVADRATHSKNGDYDDPQCGGIFDTRDDFDYVNGEPADRQILNYEQQLERWARLKRDSAADPWSTMSVLDRSVQLRPVWFLSLAKASAGLSACAIMRRRTLDKPILRA
jgi:hypothetical protein